MKLAVYVSVYALAVTGGLLGAASSSSSSSGAPLPNFVYILQDDLGRYDTLVGGASGGGGNPSTAATSGNVTLLAEQGILLNRFYVHWHCSPSRRSFLTGRLPIHHGEFLSGTQTDDIDLRWNWITDKLKPLDYKMYWFGKGHTGYKSFSHLPEAHGFDESTFFLSGSGSYTTLPRWNGTAPLSPPSHQYSTEFYGSLAVNAVENHDTSNPFFLYLPFQAVHTPYDTPPKCKGSNPPSVCKNVLYAMFQDADIQIGLLINALKKKGMYDNTLIIYSADNGGVTNGNNYPLRGEKHTNFEGGMRVTAFVSGGLVPKKNRGTKDESIYHVVDLYPSKYLL